MADVVKFGFYLILSAIFLYMMAQAFQNLQSEKYGVTSTRETGANFMPSFTLCPWTGFGGDQFIEYDQVSRFMTIENLSQNYMNISVSKGASQ